MDEAEIIKKARQSAEEIMVFVTKYRTDPENYLTSHEELDVQQAQADLWTWLADALEGSREREESA